jgi:hypothetical protein
MRCTSCDKVMQPNEIIWRPEQNQHDPWCGRCRRSYAQYEEPLTQADADILKDIEFEIEEELFDYE